MAMRQSVQFDNVKKVEFVEHKANQTIDHNYFIVWVWYLDVSVDMFYLIGDKHHMPEIQITRS